MFAEALTSQTCRYCLHLFELCLQLPPPATAALLLVVGGCLFQGLGNVSLNPLRWR